MPLPVEPDPLKMRFCKNCKNYVSIPLTPKCDRFNETLTMKDRTIRAETCPEYSNKYETDKT